MGRKYCVTVLLKRWRQVSNKIYESLVKFRNFLIYIYLRNILSHFRRK